jgi:hypothetical protein
MTISSMELQSNQGRQHSSIARWYWLQDVGARPPAAATPTHPSLTADFSASFSFASSFRRGARVTRRPRRAGPHSARNQQLSSRTHLGTLVALQNTVDAELEQAVAALTAHFAAHPNAADAVDGIAAWWLAGAVPKPVVERALQWLVDEGVVVAKRMANGTVIYALKK